MEYLTQILSFLAGVLATAILSQFVERYFSAPRVRVAISEVLFTRTRHRSLKCIPITEELRLLLSEHPTSHIDWDDQFTSEYAIDYSILQLIEREKHHDDWKRDLQRRLATLTSTTVKDQVLSLGRDQNLIFALVNAFIEFPDRIPQLTDQQTQKPEVFPIRRLKKTIDGDEREIVHLDIPGNPFPVVGSSKGRSDLNQKTAPIAYALSRCDADMLRKIFELGVAYCSSTITHAATLRAMLSAMKHEETYLHVQLLVSNLGKSGAFLANRIELVPGNEKSPVTLSMVLEVEKEQDLKHSTTIRDNARMLMDWIPTSKEDLRDFEAPIENVSVEQQQSRTIRFVSDNSVSDAVVKAIQAMNTGYTTCTISLWQYLPKNQRFLPRLGKFRRRITSIQRNATS